MSTRFGESVEEAALLYGGDPFTVYDISLSIGCKPMSINCCCKIRYHLKRLGYKCKQVGDHYSYYQPVLPVLDSPAA